jgi:hypothetical protein
VLLCVQVEQRQQSLEAANRELEIVDLAVQVRHTYAYYYN